MNDWLSEHPQFGVILNCIGGGNGATCRRHRVGCRAVGDNVLHKLADMAIKVES